MMNAEVKAKLNDLLTGVDGPTKQRALAVGVALYDAYATSWPGPFDATAKATMKPHVTSWIEQAINDLCSGI